MKARYLDTWELNKHHKPGLLQKVQLALTPDDKTLIGSLDPTKLARAVDVSHWQGEIDVRRIKDDGDVALLLPKASDGKQVQAGDPTYEKNYVDDYLYRNVQKAYDTKIACAPYHYAQPYLSADYTVQGTIDWNMETLHAAFDPLVPGKSYQAISLDVEEKTASPLNGSDVILGIIKELGLDPKFNQVPLIIYTSMSVLNYYTKLREQISYQGANRNLWMAQWVYNTTTTTTWADMISRIMPQINMKVLTPGYANWKFLQWSSSFILPGCAGRMDQNVYNGTKAQLYAWLKFEPGTTPPDEPPSGELEERVERLESITASLDAEVDTLRTEFVGLRDNLHNV
jgi:GH25 family lysozyme M1 (1,4-beta-N-acetylmuramidase)